MKQVSKLDTTKLDRLIAELESRADAILRATAKEIEVEAKINIMRPLHLRQGQMRPLHDTGALLNSIQSDKRGRLAYWIHDGVNYGVFWELGFHQMVWGKFQLLRLSQHPFLIPAVEKVRAKFNQAWAELFKP